LFITEVNFHPRLCWDHLFELFPCLCFVGGCHFRTKSWSRRDAASEL
jgi:hypothetical protein